MAQDEVLDYIERKGNDVTIKEICGVFELSQPAANRVVKSLSKFGFISAKVVHGRYVICAKRKKVWVCKYCGSTDFTLMEIEGHKKYWYHYGDYELGCRQRIPFNKIEQYAR